MDELWSAYHILLLAELKVITELRFERDHKRKAALLKARLSLFRAAKYIYDQIVDLRLRQMPEERRLALAS